MSTHCSVVCVLRNGREYRPEYVNALFQEVEDNWWPEDEPPKLVVLTDSPVEDYGLLGHLGVQKIPLLYNYPKWWCKMEMFRPDLDRLGDILFFDLDTVIVGSLRDIIEVSYLTMLQDFYTAEAVGSGMMYLPAVVRPAVWAVWASSPQSQMNRYRGDQEFLRPLWEDSAERWQRLLPGQVVSYKAHVKPSGQVPEGARVVCFHGGPRPWDVAGGLFR